MCKKLDGVIIDQLKCPNSERVRDMDFCLLQDQPVVYFNGCSKSIGNYGKTFFNPCLKHDFCYHHEPATNGLTQKDCDSQFYDNMLDVCAVKESLNNFLSCTSIAWAFYKAVRVAGKKSWQCSNSFFDYSNINKIVDSIN